MKRVDFVAFPLPLPLPDEEAVPYLSDINGSIETATLEQQLADIHEPDELDVTGLAIEEV